MRLLKYLLQNNVLKSLGKNDSEAGRSGEKSCELDQARSSEIKTNLSDILEK